MTTENNTKGGPYAKVICDSISPDGVRLTTMEVKLHRFVLAELNKHRVFSQNSASSRAIPIEKQIKMIQEDLAYPIYWGKNQKGMQAACEIDKTYMNAAKTQWLYASHSAIEAVKNLQDFEVHKQLANRLLEPFMWHKVIITATEWANFYTQRIHPDAQPEMRAAAQAMYDAQQVSVPNRLEYGEWHLPYITQEDWDAISDWTTEPVILGFPVVFRSDSTKKDSMVKTAKKISTARCARVSYLTHDGKRDIQTDIEMFHGKLLRGGHWSPFEHVATPSNKLWRIKFLGNFRGWKQFRKEFDQENHTEYVPYEEKVAAFYKEVHPDSFINGCFGGSGPTKEEKEKYDNAKP